MLDRILIGSSAEPSDPNFKNVTLLLHGDGSNGAQNNTFIDSSTNNFTITRNGNTTQGSFSPYGSNWSNYFDGSGDYLTATSNAAFQFGTGDFTIEAWIYVTNYASTCAIFDTRTSGNEASGVIFYVRSDGKIELYRSAAVVTASTALSQNSWNHVAVTRSGSTCTLWLNGVSVGTATDSTNLTQQNSFIGAAYTGSANMMVGYISNLRVVKGTAVYTSAFTPSTTPLTAITNTSLLTCAYNRFRDGSTNNFTITANGDVKVTNFAPFAPSSAYSTTTNGGSAYFDGSGDWLEVPSNTAFAYGTGDLTLECWIYKTSTSDTGILENRSGSGMIWYIDSSAPYAGMMRIYDGSGFYNSNTVVPLNQWVHLVACRQSGTLRYFINGVAAGSMSWTTDLGSPTSLKLMRSNEASQYGGWMSQMRIVKGTAVYTAAFTPPTAPLTAISGTSLLVNATNAAIFDNSMKNDLETVGNAQISTSVKKFGTGSMAFDGTSDGLFIPATPQLGFGTGDYTVEFWLYMSALPGSKYTLLDFRTASVAEAHTIYVNSSGYMGFFNGSSDVTSSSQPLSINTWYHVAYSRGSGTLKIFVAGTQAYSAANTIDYQATRPLTIGAGVSGIEVLNGYIDDLRITKGVARYTANFTAPTAPFPNK